jgi:hypothetical protein
MVPNRVIAREAIAPAWEASLELFLRSEGLNRYDSRGVPCVEIEDLLFDISHPVREPRVSSLYPKHLHSLVEDFTSRLIAPQSGQTSIINDRLYRWRLQNGSVLNQLETVLEMLHDNPDVRYSLVGLWDPEQDLQSSTPVGPLILYPRIRGGALNLTVVTRTLDAMLGAVQLIVGFSNLQEHMASILHKGVGHLRVLTLSYHLHDMDVPLIRSMLDGS